MCANRGKRSISGGPVRARGSGTPCGGWQRSPTFLLENYKVGGLRGLRALTTTICRDSIRDSLLLRHRIRQSGPYAPRAGYDFINPGPRGTS